MTTYNVFCRSEFNAATQPTRLIGYAESQPGGDLYVHLDAYPLTGTLILKPVKQNAEVVQLRIVP